MKKAFGFWILTLLISSCNLPGAATPTSIPLTKTPIALATDTPAGGNVVSLNNISLTIPTGLADDAESETVPAQTDPNTSPWDMAPEHLKFILTGYELQDKFHQPQIFIYPADEFAQVNSIAAEQIDRLKKILAGSPPFMEILPNVPFFNAAAQIAAQVKLLPFQSGRGVRALQQYSQYAAPINNRELFYHFQGLAEDGRTYIIAILPVTAPILAEDEKPDAPVPAQGVPIPTDVGPNDVYYASITEKLNSLSPDEFTPSLDTLDTLVQSILVTNP